jgi:carboxymethylenebutenolidase
MSNGTNVTLSTGAHAEVFEGPKGAPTIIVVHEWWGLNDDIRRLCRRFVSEGFGAMAVDLFGGKLTTDPTEAAQFAGDMKTEASMATIAAAAKWLHEHGSAKVAVTGFCLGGAMALAAACTVEGLAAAVPFYGIPKAEFIKFGKATPPICGHYSKSDAWASLERASAIAGEAKAAGASFALHAYDGPHAFMREADPNAYHEASAKAAWATTIAFLKEKV